MKINLFELYQLQAELDKDIAVRHNIDYPSTFSRRLLALLVELSEFANETRCFKFWSLKGPSPIDTIAEEYVDGLHFILSLGIYLSPRKYDYDIVKNSKCDLTLAILETYKTAIALQDNFDLDHYEAAMNSYLNLISYFDLDVDKIVKAYKSKLAINFQRQVDKY